MSHFPLTTRWWIAAATAVAMSVCLATAGRAARSGGDEEVVDRFLTRLGLADLRMIHLEQTIAEDRPSERRLELARRLADLYVQRLMLAATDTAKAQDLRDRITILGENVPEVNTALFQVTVLQADYKRAEREVIKWLHDPNDRAAHDAGKELLDRIVPELNGHRDKLNAEADGLQREIDELDKGDLLTMKLKEFDRLQPVAGRATYWASWANYYYGLVRSRSAVGKGEFIAAQAGFRRILGIAEGERYDEMESQWLGLKEDWASLAMIGLGLTEAALGNVQASRDCFALLQDVSAPPKFHAPPKFRDEAPYWLVRGLIVAGHFDDARRYAQQQIDAFSGDASPGKVGLCSALMRAAAANRGEMTPERAKATSMLGITGLLKLRQFATARRLMAEHGIEPDEQSGFFIPWLAGDTLFSKAEQSKDPKDYRAAVKKLSAALDTAEAASEIVSAAECRNRLAWCYYRLKDYEQAAGEFEKAAEALEASGSKKAVTAFWMTYVSYRHLIYGSEPARTSAIAVLEKIQRRFPDNPLAGKAAYTLTRLRDGSSDPPVVEYHYRALLLARKSGDEAGCRLHADWLVREAVGSKYELPALIVLASDADRENARELYARMVEILGDSEEAIRSNKNARLVNVRLAECLSGAGKHTEAAERMEKVLLAYPKDRKYLRHAGRARFQSGDYRQALPHWRILLLGLSKNSDAWYEAKYHQLACLAECDEETFRKVFDQFKLLHPDLGTETWQDKFKSLPR